MTAISTFINQFVEDESGQGITEYGAILAFVAILIGIVFGAARGQLASAISTAFQNVVTQLNTMTGSS